MQSSEQQAHMQEVAAEMGALRRQAAAARQESQCQEAKRASAMEAAKKLSQVLDERFKEVKSLLDRIELQTLVSDRGALALTWQPSEALEAHHTLPRLKFGLPPCNCRTSLICTSGVGWHFSSIASSG